MFRGLKPAKAIRLTSNNSGAALIQVLIVLLVLSILGTALIGLSTTEVWQGERSNKQKQAYYYARSGVEMARRQFDNDVVGRISSLPFYLYGSLEGSVTEAAAIDATIRNQNAIVTEITGTVTGSVTNVTIFSTGTMQDVKKTVTYRFSYSAGGSSTYPIPPDTGPGGDGLLAGPEGMDWHDTYGVLRPGGSYDPTSVKPVVFDVSVVGGYVYDKSEGTPMFVAPSMYFMDTPFSLIVNKNKSTLLKTDFLYFYGNIAGEDDRSTCNISTNNSSITGSDIPGGLSGTTYGILYLSADVLISTESSEVLHFPTGDKGPGYYFFPSGVNLLSDQGIDSLIKIDDITLVNRSLLDKLGVTITTGGSTTSGTYQ